MQVAEKSLSSLESRFLVNKKVRDDSAAYVQWSISEESNQFNKCDKTAVRCGVRKRQQVPF